MFFLWYCFDDHLAKWLHLPFIGNSGWIGFVILLALNVWAANLLTNIWPIIGPEVAQAKRTLTGRGVLIVGLLIIAAIAAFTVWAMFYHAAHPLISQD